MLGKEIIMGLVALLALGVIFYFWGDPVALIGIAVIVIELLMIVYHKFIR